MDKPVNDPKALEELATELKLVESHPDKDATNEINNSSNKEHSIENPSNSQKSDVPPTLTLEQFDEEDFALTQSTHAAHETVESINVENLNYALEVEKKPFLSQGLRYTAIGLAFLILPLITYAKLAGMTIPNRMIEIMLLAQWFALAPVIGVMFTAFGLMCIIGGINFVNAAKRLSSQNGEPVTLELNYEKKKTSLDGSRMFSAQIKYADERTEKIRMSGSLKDNFDAIVGTPQRAIFYGTPFMINSPRVLVTKCGTLLSLANEVALLSNLRGPDNTVTGPSIIGNPLVAREKQLLKDFLTYAVLLVLISLTFFLSSPTQIWFLLAVFGTGFAVRIASLIETKMAARALRYAEGTDCSVRITTTKFRGFKTNVLSVGSTEPTDMELDVLGFNPSMNSQPFQGKLYQSPDGKTLAIAGPGVTLFKSRLGKLSLAPAAVYLCLMPIFFQSIQNVPSKKAPVECKTAQEYYDKGVEYKTLGWTEKSRTALNEAIKMDTDGAVKKKALRYMHSKLPANPVTEEAEQMNIQGFNLTFRKPEEAKAKFEEAIRKYPNFEWPRSNLASILTEEGKPELAVPLLEKALEINPHYTNALRHMVTAQLKLGNRTAARHYLDMAIASDPDDNLLKLQRVALDCSI